MDVKRWFERAYKADKRINELVRVREALYHQALKVTPAYTGDVRVQTSPANTREALYAKIADQEAQINAKIDALVMVKAEIMDVINQVDDNTLSTLLMARHIRFQSWRRIAITLEKSEDHVRGALYQKALQAAEPFAEKYFSRDNTK